MTLIMIVGAVAVVVAVFVVWAFQAYMQRINFVGWDCNNPTCDYGAGEWDCPVCEEALAASHE